MIHKIMTALAGGGMIGCAVSMLLLLEGRVFGVSSILAGVVYPVKGDFAWRMAAVLGLVAAGILSLLVAPGMLNVDAAGSPGRYALAGLLVGFGTQLGSGCTSGHGVCGISRFSIRSLVATITFIVAGIAMVAGLRFAGVIS